MSDWTRYRDALAKLSAEERGNLRAAPPDRWLGESSAREDWEIDGHY